MLLTVELLFFAILIMIFSTVINDEIYRRRRASHLVKLKSYWEGKDRRLVERHKANLDVKYSINHDFKGAKTRDVSTCGIGLILDEKFKGNAVLKVEIKLDDEYDPIIARARVMWPKELHEAQNSPKRLFDTGLKFIKFYNASQEKRLFDYIRELENSSREHVLPYYYSAAH